MMKRVVFVAAMACALSVGTARAAGTCTPGPFGDSDDTGVISCNKAAATCENKAGTAIAKLVGAIIKCHAKQADACSSGKALKVPEETCEAAAVTKFNTFSNASCPCVNVGAIATLATTILDANNGDTYCDPSGTPIGDDDAGTCGSTKTIQKAQDAAGKCVAKLVQSWFKCHAALEKAALAGKAPKVDEETCEGNATTAFNTCMTTKAAGAPCAVANSGAILGTTQTQLDGSSALIYCSSPSAAFVE